MAQELIVAVHKIIKPFLEKKLIIGQYCWKKKIKFSTTLGAAWNTAFRFRPSSSRVKSLNERPRMVIMYFFWLTCRVRATLHQPPPGTRTCLSSLLFRPPRWRRLLLLTCAQRTRAPGCGSCEFAIWLLVLAKRPWTGAGPADFLA